MSDLDHLTAIIPEKFAGWRLDRVLAEMFPDYSRSLLKSWILEGKVQLDQEKVRPRNLIEGGETIELWIQTPPQIKWQAEEMPLDIVFEDEDLIVINKPDQLVVHPGAGNPNATLVNALLYYDADLEKLPRAGIVHRLDKDTTGIMVVARSIRAHTSLVQQLQNRSLKREYQAIVNGVITAGGTVDAAIGRHPTHRTRMAVVESNGKPARTHYRVAKRYPAHSHLRLQLESGRTHQIRVHMAHIRYPIVGDPVYAGRLIMPKQATPALQEQLRNFKRQALHSTELSLEHPGSGETLHWSTELPEDMQQLLRVLEESSNTDD